MNRWARIARVAVLVAGLLIGIVEFASHRAASAQAAPGLYVSPEGDDRRDGSSPATALRTISEAMSRVRPGGTVYVAQGIYREQVVTRSGGAPGAEITVKAIGGKAVIDGSSLNWAAGTSHNQGLVELRHPYVRIVGLTVQNSKNTGILLAADDLTVEDSQIVGSQMHPISTDTTRQTSYHGNVGTMIRRIVLKNNLIERSSRPLNLIADGFLVSGNTVRDSMREGIDIWLGSRRGEVVGNTVYGNKATGIYVDGADSVKIHRNVVYRNGSGIGVTSEDKDYKTRNIWVYNNVVYDNSGAGCYIWDDKWRPGYKGSQDVLIAYNTIIGNKYTISIAGENNSGSIFNNLGYATKSNVDDHALHSSLKIQGNVWLSSITGFISADRHDYRLTDHSPAIDKGVSLPPLRDSDGAAFSIGTDFQGLNRVSGSKPDAGAFEYHASAG